MGEPAAPKADANAPGSQSLTGPPKSQPGELIPAPDLAPRRAPQLDDPDAPLLGDRYRYGRTGLLTRAALDVAAIPAGIPFWQWEDWVIFGTFAATVGTLMLPLDPSLDARFDRWVRRELDPEYPEIWTKAMQIPLWSLLGIGTLGGWAAALAAPSAELAEMFSLTLEAVGVAQLYHIVLKALIGREGPEDGTGRGRIFGPYGFWQFYPAGTPSGHAATLYSIWAVVANYWNFGLTVRIPAQLVIGALIASHVLNHRHFLSESIWGAAMGYAIGLWVVRHRSSRYRYVDGEPVRVILGPWTDIPTRARGLMLQISF